MNKEAVSKVIRLYRRYHWYRDPDMLQSMAEDVFGHHPEWVDLELEFFSRMPSCPHTDDLPYTRSNHSRMPSLVQIVSHWQEPARQLEALGLFGIWIGPAGNHEGHPNQCFGCGRPAGGRAVWDPVMPGDFERAHLQDSCLGGTNEVENLIPLCSVCHWQMTANFSGCRGCAARWVRWLGRTRDELSRAEADK